MTDRDIIERLRAAARHQKVVSTYVRLCREAADTIERLQRERNYLKLQAETHAQEARCANHTIGEIYQVVTGKTGEPGNWNGAIPVREAFELLTAREQKLVKALRTLRGLINEGGAPRYTITPGAAFNSFVEEDLDPLLAALSDGGGKI